MPRMKIILLISPFAILSSLLLAAIPTLQGDSSLDPLLRALSELPLVGGAVWLVIRLQDKQQQTVAQLMTHFEARAEAKDSFYQQLLKDQNKTITELAKKG